MTRKRLIIIATSAVLLILAIVIAVALQQRVRRHRVFRPTAEQKSTAPQAIPPVEQWSATFRTLDGEELASLLSQIEAKHPDLYAKWSLAYLHARALVEADDRDAAAAKLAPFLAKGHPFRDRALFHRASIAEG